MGNRYSDVDEDYPIIQSCGFKYAEKIKDIFETFGLKNTFNFGFGRLEATGTIYFKRKNDDSIHVGSAGALRLENPKLYKCIILVRDF
jgi:hypothetical protein